MEVKAIAKYVRVQPRKVRIVADEVRGKSATQAAALLRFHPSKGAFMLRKVLISAIHNALENHNLAPEVLKIAAITVDEGPRMKRMQARAMGRGNRIVKKTSHITVVVTEDEGRAPSKATQTKPKARPTFAVAAPKKGKKKDEPKVEAVAEETPVEEVVEETVVEETAVEAEAPTAEESSTEEVVAEAGEEASAEVAEEAKKEAE